MQLLPGNRSWDASARRDVPSLLSPASEGGSLDPPRLAGKGRERLWRRWLRHILRRFLTGRIAEMLEEIGIRSQHQPRVVWAQSRLIGLHGTVEGKEIRILAIGLGEDAVAFAIALATSLLGARLRLRHQHRDVAVGLSADLLALLAALTTGGRGLTLTLGLHALIDGLAVLLRQIGAPDAYVNHLDAEGTRFAVQLIAYARHQRGTLVAHHMDQGGFSEHPP